MASHLQLVKPLGNPDMTTYISITPSKNLRPSSIPRHCQKYFKDVQGSIQITIPYYATKCVRTHSHTMNLMTMPLSIPLAHHSFHLVMVAPTAYLTCTVFIDAHHSFGVSSTFKSFFKKLYSPRSVSNRHITKCYHCIFISS